PFIHVQTASALSETRLRLLPPTARRGPNEVRSIARQPARTRRKANSAAAVCCRESAEGNERLRRATRRGEYSVVFLQDARRPDQGSDRRGSGRLSKASRDGCGQQRLSRLSKADRLFQWPHAQNHDRRRRLETARWRCLL